MSDTSERDEGEISAKQGAKVEQGYSMVSGRGYLVIPQTGTPFGREASAVTRKPNRS